MKNECEQKIIHIYEQKIYKEIGRFDKIEKNVLKNQCEKLLRSEDMPR